MNANRLISALLIAVLMFSAVNLTANAAVIFNEDFEKLPVGSKVGNEWNAALSQDSAITVDTEEEHGNVLKIADRSTEASCSVMRKFPKQNGTVVWQFDYKVSGAENVNESATFKLLHGDLEAVTLNIVAIPTDAGRAMGSLNYDLMNSDGTILRKGTADIFGNRWYTIAIVADTKKMTFSMYLNGEPMVNDAPFFRKTAFVDGIRFSTGPWIARNLWFDNISVTNGMPDEAALGLHSSIKSTGVDYGDYLIREADNRKAGENLDDWNSNRAVNGRTSVVEEDTGKYFSLKVNNPSNILYIYKAFTPQRDKISLSLKFRQNANASGSRIVLRNSKIPLIELRTFKKDDKIWLSEFTGGGIYNPLYEIKSNNWHELRVNADIKKCIFDVFLDGVSIAENKYFQRKTECIDTLAFFSGYGNYEFGIKDITVTEKGVSGVRGEPMPDANDTPPPKLTTEVTYQNFKGCTFSSNMIKYKLSDGSIYLPAIEDDINDLIYAGVHWVRLSVSNTDNLDNLDIVVNKLYANNMKAIMYYNKNYPGKYLGTPEQELENAEFIKKVVNRYKDKIRDWEIHNEPNLNDFWIATPAGKGGSGDKIKEYVIHLENMYKAIKSVDPKLNVVLGGISEWGAEKYMARLGEEKAYLYFDEVAFHPYADTPDGVAGRLRSFNAAIALWPEPYNKFPVWITEIGYHSELGWTVPGTLLDEITKALYLTPTFEKLYEEMGQDVRPIMWYTFQENSGTKGYGLTRKSFTDEVFKAERLPALDTLRVLDDVTPRKTNETKPDKPTDTVTDVDEQTIIIDWGGEHLTFDVKPYIKDGRVFVPVRAFFEKAGATVSYDERTRTVTAEKEGKSVACTVDSPFAEIEGVAVKLDAIPELKEGRIMVPLRLLAEGLDCDVKWNEISKTVEIKTR